MPKQEKEIVSIKDVAKLAGVSISTVSHVINETKSVSPALAAKVRQAVQALDYEVNPMGRGLKSNRTNRIGLIVPSFYQLHFPAVLRGIYEAGLQYGYTISIFETGGEIAREKADVKRLQHSRTDGILLVSYANQQNQADRSYIRFLAKSGYQNKKIPVVSLESVLDPQIDAVIVDNKKAAETAVDHLISLDRKSLAHIAGPRRSRTGALRLAGFRSAAEKAGVPVEEALICEGDFSPVSGYQCMEKLLAQNKQITAVLAASDEMGIGAIRALLDKGYRVPEDIAVIGIDNHFSSALITPALSSVSLPQYEMGYQAMELLSERIRSPESPRRVVTLETKLIVRQSTCLKDGGAWALSAW